MKTVRVFVLSTLLSMYCACGFAQTWSAVGTGMSGYITSLSVYNGLLYAGGQFSTAGSIPVNDNIAQWNGTTWDSVGPRIACGGCGGGYVQALTVYNKF